MKTTLGLGAGALAFVMLATANSGGYRFGISDQAFYIPAIARAADASLFPRDTALLLPQMRVWAGDELLAAVLRTFPLDLPQLFAVLYVAGLLLLFAAVVFLARGLGASWWAVAGASALLTLRHRIAKTGANSLEGYMHPRMIAFALGLIALGFVVKRRLLPAIVCVALTALVHPTTALWFAGVAVVAALARLDRRSRWNLLGLIPLFLGLTAARHILGSSRIDAEWLAVLGEKDYLFSHEWPLYAWLINLGYPVVLWLLYQRRRSLGRTAAGEGALVIGLFALVAGFLVSVPLAAMHIAPVVQLQVNRVFWLLDAVVLVYLAWWLVDDLGHGRTGRFRAAAVVLLVLLSAARGVFVLAETHRPLARLDLAEDDWTAAMRWLRHQPADWLILADPGHAWRYGTSVRVGALRDTVLESGKDSAMAMYDRSVAMRVAERTHALSGFESATSDELRDLGRRYGAHAVVLERGRPLDLPALYENARFGVYALR